jgi:hypothetical protein
MHMNNTRKETGSMSRRSFMQVAGLGAAAAGAAALAAGGGSREAEAAESPAANGSGYRETDHIRAYYEFSRF